MTPVGTPAFRRYLRAGALWPQLRSPLACAIVDGAAGEGAPLDLPALLVSRLSDRQLAETAATVTALHARFGIPDRGPIAPQGLQDEWVKSLNAVAYVALTALGAAPDPVYDGYARYVTADTLRLLDHSRASPAVRDALAALRTAHRVFAANTRLARAFRATFTPRTRSPQTRVACMDEMRDMIDQALGHHADGLRATLALGLDALAYRRARQDAVRPRAAAGTPEAS